MDLTENIPTYQPEETAKEREIRERREFWASIPDAHGQVAAFIGDRTMVAPSQSVSAADLYAAFRAFATTKNWPDCSIAGKRSFGLAASQILDRRRTNSGRFYVGIALTERENAL